MQRWTRCEVWMSEGSEGGSMSIDEAIYVVQMSIEYEHRNGGDPTPYDLLRICEQLLIVVMLLQEEQQKCE